MPEPRSPLLRPIGGSGILRFLIAIVGVLAIAGAFNAGRPVLGIGGALFVVVALLLGRRAARARQDAGEGAAPNDP